MTGRAVAANRRQILRAGPLRRVLRREHHNMHKAFVKAVPRLNVHQPRAAFPPLAARGVRCHRRARWRRKIGAVGNPALAAGVTEADNGAGARPVAFVITDARHVRHRSRKRLDLIGTGKPLRRIPARVGDVAEVEHRVRRRQRVRRGLAALHQPPHSVDGASRRRRIAVLKGPVRRVLPQRQTCASPLAPPQPQPSWARLVPERTPQRSNHPRRFRSGSKLAFPAPGATGTPSGLPKDGGAANGSPRPQPHPRMSSTIVRDATIRICLMHKLARRKAILHSLTARHVSSCLPVDSDSRGIPFSGSNGNAAVGWLAFLVAESDGRAGSQLLARRRASVHQAKDDRLAIVENIKADGALTVREARRICIMGGVMLASAFASRRGRVQSSVCRWGRYEWN